MPKFLIAYGILLILGLIGLLFFDSYGGIALLIVLMILHFPFWLIKNMLQSSKDKKKSGKKKHSHDDDDDDDDDDDNDSGGSDSDD